MKLRFFVPVLALFIVASTSEKSYGNLTPVSEEIKKLYFFIGNWKGKATSSENGQSQSFDYNMDFKTDAAGWGLLYHENGAIPNAEPYIGFGMIGVDPADNAVHIFTVSNYGDVHDHKGIWTDGKHISLVYNGKTQGKQMKEELSINYVDANTFTFKDVVTIDGQIMQTLNAEMHKTGK